MHNVSPARSNLILPLVVCVLLAATTWLVFGQTLKYQFVNYDDDSYVFDNPHVTRGLTLQGVKWALTHSHSNNWHPLTTISHMLDCQVFGLKPGGHHFTNLSLHISGVVLCFLVLWQMTAALWR